MQPKQPIGLNKDPVLCNWISTHGHPEGSAREIRYGTREEATVPPNSVNTQVILPDGRLLRVDSVSPYKGLPHTEFVTVEHLPKRNVSADAIPLTDGILYLSKALKAIWKRVSAEEKLWTLGHLPEPPNATQEARKAFFGSYLKAAERMRLSPNEYTFETLMAAWPDDVRRTRFTEMPQRFVFDPGFGVFPMDDVNLDTAPPAVRMAMLMAEPA